MPIYAYRCDSCGVQFEKHQSFNDDPLKICPECNEPALRKLIQPVGIVFKGSGFYVTDNRSASKSGLETTRKEKSDPPAEKSTSATASTDSGDSKKSDTTVKSD